MSLLLSVGPWVAVLVVLVGCSAFFSSSESAIFSLPAVSNEDAPASGTGTSGDSTASKGISGDGESGTSSDGSAAATLADLRADPHRLLVTLLVARYLEPGPAVAVATTFAATLVLVFGEIVPKSYGLGHARTWSLRVARPIAVVERLLGPVVFVFDVATRGFTRFLGGDADIEETYIE
jgi:CBS domain containing-hemolysin-like protein